MKKNFWILFLFLLLSCRGEEVVIHSEKEQVSLPQNTEIQGFYLLNEGAMNTNKSTLDYYDYQTGIYHRNIYAERNPSVVKELGDIGNDIKIYGSKLYAVINGSNKIEVMDVKTTKRIKTISVENARYMAFHNGKAYVSSFAGPIKLDMNSPLGKVLEIDTLTLSVNREVVVGYQPEEIEMIDGEKLWVANSGGYRVGVYDKTISVVDLKTFQEEKKIEVGLNPHHIKKDSNGNIFVNSRGDYAGVMPNLYSLNKEGSIEKVFDIPISNMDIVGDKLYYYSNIFNYQTTENIKAFGVIDTKTKKLITSQLIDETFVKEMKNPYGMRVNPISGEIYITDAGNYISTGYLYCFDKEGKFKWKVEAGNIPAHIVFVYKK